MGERPEIPARVFELPVVVPLATGLEAGGEVLHILAALPHRDGATLGIRLGRDWPDPDPALLANPVDAARRPPVLEVETGDGRGTFDLVSWNVECDGRLMLGPSGTPGTHGVWMEPLPTHGPIRLRLRVGDVAGEWAEIDPAPLRDAATRAVPLWAAYYDDGESDEDLTAIVERALEDDGSWTSYGSPGTEGRPTRPPADVLAGTLPLQEVVARDDRHALVVGPVRVFPHGLVVEIAALARTGPVRALIDTVYARLDGIEGPRVVPEMLRLEVEDAGGGRWSSIEDGNVPWYEREDGVLRGVVWLVGRPVPGPLTLRLAWPWAELEGAVEIDGGEVLRLAAACEDLAP